MYHNRPRSGSRRRSNGESYVSWDDSSKQFYYYCNSERNGERCRRWVAAPDMFTPSGHESGHKCPCGKWISGAHLSAAGRQDLRGDANTPSRQQNTRPNSDWSSGSWQGGWKDSQWQSSEPPKSQSHYDDSQAQATPPLSPRSAAEAKLLSMGKSQEEITPLLEAIFPEPPPQDEPPQGGDAPSIQERLATAHTTYRQKVVTSNAATQRRMQIAKTIQDLETKLGTQKDKFRDATEKESQAMVEVREAADARCSLQAEFLKSQHGGQLPEGAEGLDSSGLEGPLQHLRSIQGIDGWATETEKAVKLGEAAIDLQMGLLKQKLLDQHNEEVKESIRVLEANGFNYPIPGQQGQEGDEEEEDGASHAGMEVDAGITTVDLTTDTGDASGGGSRG